MHAPRSAREARTEFFPFGPLDEARIQLRGGRVLGTFSFGGELSRLFGLVTCFYTLSLLEVCAIFRKL